MHLLHLLALTIYDFYETLSLYKMYYLSIIHEYILYDELCELACVQLYVRTILKK